MVAVLEELEAAELARLAVGRMRTTPNRNYNPPT
jgi:hypothetical protein